MMHYRPHRYLTQFPVDMRTPAGLQRGKVLDVNNGGARVSGLRNLRQGDKIELELLSHRLTAVIRWTRGESTGITFLPRITDHQVDTLRYRPDGRKNGGRGSVGFGFAQL